MSIRNKLILAFLVATITPILLLTITTGNSIKKNSLQAFHESTNTEMTRIEKALFLFIRAAKESASTIVNHPDVMATDDSITSFLDTTSEKSMADFSPNHKEQRVLDLFHSMKVGHKAYVDVFMGTKFGGFTIANKTMKLPAGYDPRTRGWYKDPLNTPGKPFLGKAYQSTSGDAVISVTQAITRQGEIIGVSGIDISLKGLTQFFKDIRIGKTGYIMLIQDDGVILADPGHSDTGFKKLTETGMPGLSELARAADGDLEIELDGTTYIAQILTSESLGWKLVGLIQKSEVMAKVYRLLSVMAIIGVVLVILFVAAGFFMARSLSNPIVRTTNMVKDIAQGEGDLTKRLESNSNDELGELAKWFNLFVENLQGIIGELRDNVIIVNDSSAELLSLSNEMDASAKTSSDLAKTVSNASDTLNGNMTNIAAAMDETTQNTNVVATAAEEMNATINEIAQNSAHAKEISEQAVEQMQGASTKMQHLGSAAESISAVTDAIAGISDQTNLLALNATIEAARAGEAGKGFAVVANEIKDLASQTADATADIKRQIEGIQATSHETIGEIESVYKVMNDINSIIITIATAIEEQSAATQEIASNIAQVSQGTQDVNDNIGDSSRAIDKTNEDISSMDAAVQNISQNSGHIAKNLERLKDMARDLTNIVNQFKI